MRWFGWFRWRALPVRLHLKDTGPSVEGVLVARPGRFYRLAQANVVAEAGQSYPAGEVWVPSVNVLFWQEVSS